MQGDGLELPDWDAGGFTSHTPVHPQRTHLSREPSARPTMKVRLPSSSSVEARISVPVGRMEFSALGMDGSCYVTFGKLDRLRKAIYVRVN
jgi:hypothetical protein